MQRIINGNTYEVVETLAILGVPRKLTASAASSNIALTEGIRGIRITAVGSAVRFDAGSGPRTATVNSHYLGAEQSMDIAVTSQAPNIACMRAGSTDAALEISEMLE